MHMIATEEAFATPEYLEALDNLGSTTTLTSSAMPLIS